MEDINWTTKLNNIINNEAIEKITFESNSEFILFLKLIKDKYLANRFMIEFEDSEIRTLSDIGIQNLLESINNITEEDNNYEQLFDFNTNKNNSVTISRFINRNENVGYENREGGFVRYLHNTNYDFSRYQLFSTFDASNYNNSCLYVALSNYDLPTGSLNIIKTNVLNRNITKSSLKKLAQDMGIIIALHEYKTNNTSTNTTCYGTVGVVCHISLYDSHYFTHDENLENIFKGGVYINGKKITTSLGLFRVLYTSDGLLTPINNYELNSIGYNTDRITDLQFNINCMELKNDKYQENMFKDNIIIKDVYFADFECFEDSEGKHVAYQLGFIQKDEPEENFHCYNYVNEKTDLSSMMFDYICSKQKSSITNNSGIILVIFHNAKYDSCFLNFNKMYNLNLTTQDKNFYNLSFDYYYKNTKYYFHIRDSYKHLSYSLSEFPKLFNMKEEFKQKEIIPYKFYNLENIKKCYCSIQDAVDCLKRYKFQCTNKDIDQFLLNINKWSLKYGKNYDIIEYSLMYNKLDVLILREAFTKWHQQVHDITGLNIYKILTSAGLAQKYFESKNTYKYVKKINQMPRKFIQQSVYGGRCMSNQNKKYIVEDKIQDFDGVSLYPSAVYRLKELGGILKGYPKIINEEQLNMQFLNSVDGYFIDIEIISLKRRDFPLIPCREDNLLIYDADKIIGKTITVSKIQAEDLIGFCDCKFDIKRGYYFNEGRDSTMCDVIYELFQKRLEYKERKNPLQEVIKLIMNSVYGKTIQKSVDSAVYIVKNDKVGDISNEYDWFVNKHYNRIKSINRISNSNKFIIHKFEDINDNYTMPHVGSEILAMSKRIMSEVMCLAEDNDIKIYYQDTDSMHIRDNDIPKLSKLFLNTYGRVLIGEGLGQFHSDFKSNILKGPLHSKKFIVLGKKSYFDLLSDEYNNTDHHSRMKGIPETSIKKYLDVNKDINMTQMYLNLYNGEKIIFDLTCDNQVPKFNINSFVIISRPSFNRIVAF